MLLVRLYEGTEKTVTAADDSLPELPDYIEERRLMKAAFERMSSPGLGILTASSKSNAKMQALISGGPSHLPKQGEPPVQMPVKFKLRASPFAALAVVSTHERDSSSGDYHPREDVAPGVEPGIEPGVALGVAPGVVPGDAIASASRPLESPTKPVSASPFARGTNHPLPCSNMTPGTVQSGVRGHLEPAVVWLHGGVGEGEGDPSRHLGLTVGLPPGGASDLLNSLSQTGSSFPESGSSAPPPVVGQLADIPSMVELELDFDR